MKWRLLYNVLELRNDGELNGKNMVKDMQVGV